MDAYFPNSENDELSNFNNPLTHQIEEVHINDPSYSHNILQDDDLLENEFESPGPFCSSECTLGDLNQQSIFPENNQLAIEEMKIEQEKMLKEMNKYRMKEKLLKAKSRIPEGDKAIKKEPINPRKEKRLLRNRMSAQKSRERKTHELNMLRAENEELRASKAEAEEKLLKATTELDIINRTVKLLPTECREEFTRIKETLEYTVDSELWLTKSTKRRNSFLLAGALLGCLCVIGCISPFIIDGYTKDYSVESQMRLLASDSFLYNDYCQTICNSIDRFNQCRREFIDNNLHIIIDNSGYDEGLAIYHGDRGVCNSDNEMVSMLNQRTDTVYTSNAYLLSSAEEDSESLM
eukprot:TRINITY_DN3790_c0_g1_i5.p1 TRINITY_DN3790_c0_g1~~TRINITY_DN3790_c0_g1_i5.p1  ORF type:complete len:350 (-),score=61.36 TRINITY_DN3790_c0_g1_i5:360-1409(-)